MVDTGRGAALMHNLRGLGGLPTTDGRRVRANRLYRSEAPCDLAADALEALDALGLRTVIDLRGVDEARARPAALPAAIRRVGAPIEPPPVDEHGRDLLEVILAGELRDCRAEHLAEILISFIDEQAAAFGCALRHLIGNDALPALVHCTAGKDRTGLVIALVLEAVGVEREAIIADYELSTAGRAYRKAELAERLEAVGTSWERVAPLFTAPRAALEAVFAHIDARYGGVRAYLVDGAGCIPDELDRLAAQLVAGHR